ncbi:MAG: GNAT family N-acetyltransferase [Enterococcus sp.]
MLTYRIATPTDAKALVAIYAPYVNETTITFECSVPTEAEFGQRICQTLKKYPYLVAENEQGELLGYAYASSYKGRMAYDWSVEVTIYLAPKAKGQGVGRTLYQKLEAYLTKQHVVNLTACINDGNYESVRFHEKFGYQKVATFPKIGFKFNAWHGVIWMQKVLNQPETQMPAFRAFAELEKGQLSAVKSR